MDSGRKYAVCRCNIMAWNVSVSPLIFFIISWLIKKLLLSTIWSVCSGSSASWLWPSWHGRCRSFWNEYLTWPINTLLRLDLVGYVLVDWVQHFGTIRYFLYGWKLFNALFSQLGLSRPNTLICAVFTFFWLLNNPSGRNRLLLFSELNSSKTQNSFCMHHTYFV